MTKSSIRCLIAACVGVWCLSFPMGAFASGFSEPACTPYANQTWRLWPVDICSEPVRWDMEMHTCPEPVHTTGLVDSWDWDMLASWVSTNKFHLAADDEDPPFPIPLPGVGDLLMDPCPAPAWVASWDMLAAWVSTNEPSVCIRARPADKFQLAAADDLIYPRCCDGVGGLGMVDSRMEFKDFGEPSAGIKARAADKLHLAADDEDPPFPIPIPGVGDSLMDTCPAPVWVASWDMLAAWVSTNEPSVCIRARPADKFQLAAADDLIYPRCCDGVGGLGMVDSRMEFKDFGEPSAGIKARAADKLHLAADDEDPPFPIPIPGVGDSLMDTCPAPVWVASWDMQAVWQLIEESISSEVMETEVMESELIDEP